jgi:hypothetical protein
MIGFSATASMASAKAIQALCQALASRKRYILQFVIEASQPLGPALFAFKICTRTFVVRRTTNVQTAQK